MLLKYYITLTLFVAVIAKKKFRKNADESSEEVNCEESYAGTNMDYDRLTTTLGPAKGEMVVEKFVETLMSSEKYLRMMEAVKRKLNHLDASFHERTNTIIKYLSEMLRILKNSAANELEDALKGVKNDLDKLKSSLTSCLDPVTNMRDEDCNVIRIEEWSGSSLRRSLPLPKPIPGAVIQHTYVYECNSDEECVDALKKIRNMHTEIMGFDDIGNSFYIGGNGKVYEGAGWNRVGAHTRFYNGRSIGISFIGDFTKKLPTKTALQAAKDLLKCGEKFGHLSSNFSLYGHLQLSSTESPGEALYEEIQTWPHWSEDVSKL